MPRNFAQSGMRSNLSDIDVFRGIAALIVAAMHTREITWVGMREFWHPARATDRAQRDPWLRGIPNGVGVYRRTNILRSQRLLHPSEPSIHTYAGRIVPIVSHVLPHAAVL